MRKSALLVVAAVIVAAAGYGLRDRIPPSWLPSSLIESAGAAPSDGGSAANGGDKAQAQDASRGGQGGGRRGGRNSIVSVATATAEAGELPVRRSTIGWIASVSETTVTTQQQGIVTAIAATNGAEVKAGDLLVQLDDRAARATLARDQAALTRDQTNVVSTKADLQRVQDLVKRNVDSAQQLDQATAAAASADAVILLDQANIAADQVVVDNMKIVAPHAGRLGAFAITVGSLVQPGNPIVTLTDVDNVEAHFTISDADVDLLRQTLAAGPVKVHLSSADAAAAPEGSTAAAVAPASAEAEINFIDSTIGQGSGSLAVRAAVANGKRVFWPGEAVKVDVDLGANRGIVIVPTVAVQQGQGGSNVFVVKDDNTIDVRPVEVAGIIGDKAGIRSGLKAGDVVVTEGQLSLATGMKVAVRAPKDAGAPGAAARKPGQASPMETAS